MYIIFDKNNKIVINQVVERPNTILNGQEIAICNNIPKYDKSLGEYLTVTNLQEKTEKYMGHDFVEKEVVIDGETQPITEAIKVEKERKYLTCDLIVSFNNKKFKENKIAELKRWFNNEYRYYAEKFTRFLALGIDEPIHDKFFDITYSNINDLYLKAESVRAEINKLETEVQ